MSGFSTFALGSSNPALATNKSRWKPEKGKYRVSFVALTGLDKKSIRFDNNPQVLIDHVKRLYHPDVGYFIDYGPEYQNVAGGASKVSLATTLAFWPLNAQGQLDKGRIAAGEYEIKVWIMSLDKYQQLVSMNQEYPLAHHDIKIDVTDAQFHKMSFTSCRDSIFKTLHEQSPDLFSQVLEIAHAVHGNIRNEIAQDLTIDQIRQKLSGQVGSPVSNLSSGSSVDADDVLDSVLGDD